MSSSFPSVWGYSIDAKSCFNPLCQYLKTYTNGGNNTNDYECSLYLWKKRKDNIDNWNSCELKKNDYKFGYKSLPTNEFEYDYWQNLTLGITRCLQEPVQDHWGNESGKRCFIFNMNKLI